MSSQFNNQIIRDCFFDETQICDLGYSEVVTVGFGPFTEFDFNNFLKTNGFKIGTPSSKIAVLIIGEEGWKKENVIEVLKLRTGDTLRVYSQEMFLLHCSLGMDPLRSSKKILKSFAEGHAGLQFLIEAGFQWPVTTIVPSF
jgi:hypothetical protein